MLWKSAYFLLVGIALILTIISGTTQQRVPVWIPVLLIAIALLVGAAH